MEVKQIEQWLNAAQPGSRICYYEGHLADDREKLLFDGGTFRTEVSEPLSTVADLVWNAYCTGKVMLFQERMEENNKFRYWASKRR